MTAFYPGVAQLVARLTGGQEAACSSHVTRTKEKPTIFNRWFFLTVFLGVYKGKARQSCLSPIRVQ